MNQSVYAEVEARSLPLIENYREDLTKHDKDTLNEHPESPFLHFTGTMGTHLVMLLNSECYPDEDVRVPFMFYTADRYHILEDKVAFIQAMEKSNRQDLILYFNGKTLKKITQGKAVEIAFCYRVNILAGWEGSHGI